MANEKFIGFKFGNDFEVGLNKTYEGFIVNEEGFAYSLGPEFDDEFVSGNYGNRTHYLGTTIGNKTFNFTVQFKELSTDEFRNVMYKLRAKKVDLLEFDQWPDWAFNVKLAGVGEATYDPIGDCDGEIKYNVNVPLSFVTVDRWWAEKVTGDETISVENPISNVGYNMENYLVIEFTGKLTVQGYEFGKENPPSNGVFYSEFGIAIGKNGEFIGSNPAARIELAPGEIKSGLVISATGGLTAKKTTRNHM